jgi:hypothetical protein
MATTKSTMTLEQIMEARPRVAAKVEALRTAIADAKELGDSQLTESLAMKFNAACEESASIMIDMVNLSFEDHLEVIKAMENQRKAAV